MSLCLSMGLVGCDKKTPISADTATSNADNTADQPTTAPPSTDTTVAASHNNTPSPSLEPTPNEVVISSYDDNMVSPQGYKGLRFGQPVDKQILATHGMVSEDENPYCYYAHDPNFVREEDEDMVSHDVHFIINNGKFSSITLSGHEVPFYTGIVPDKLTALTL